jgi:putative ABC transport system ATP-binding protein
VTNVLAPTAVCNFNLAGENDTFHPVVVAYFSLFLQLVEANMFKQLFRHDEKVQNSATHFPHLIDLQNVVKVYAVPGGDFVALKGVNLQVGKGEFVSVVGKSGSGKSTLINMISGIDRPTSGGVCIDNVPVHALNEGSMAAWRGRTLGIIFQFFQLLPMLTCLENIMLPMDFCNQYKESERKTRAFYLLEQVEMVDQAAKLPGELSGGQQQRVAIARALANDPPILLADEPTGNLDSKTADSIFALFETLVENGRTILMVTHERDLARRTNRIITLADGEIVEQLIF